MQLPGTAIPASTTRQGVAHESNMTLRKVLGLVEQPQDPKWIYETFGQNTTMPFAVYADWPNTETHIMPVQPGDTIKRTDNNVSYSVFGVKAYRPNYIKIYVEIQPGT